MKYEVLVSRRREAEEFAKALLEKACRRSEETNEGRMEYAFVAGYLESALAQVAAESPSALKALKGMV